MSLADQAKEHMALAEKAMKPSWMSLKFAPDLEVASMEYSQAATKFRAASMLDDSIKAWVKAADLKKQTYDTFGAARAYESAGAISEGQPEGLAEAVALWTEAAHCYRLAGKSESATKMTLKLAGVHEKAGDVEHAKECYHEALSIIKEDGKDYELRDTYRAYLTFLVSNRLFTAALEIIDENIEALARQQAFALAFKEMLCKVVLNLYMEDVMRAEESLGLGAEIVDGWFMSKECQAGSDLVEAFKAYDQEAVTRLLKDPVFTFLPVEVARVAMVLRVAPAAVPANVVEGAGDAEAAEAAAAAAVSTANNAALLM